MNLLPSPVNFLNAIAKIDAPDARQGMRYGSRPRHVLDVYPAAASHPTPVIVFFYGGGWEGGDRANYFFVGSALASRGFTTVIPDYRVYPEVHFPGFVEDAAAVMRWTVDRIAEFGGDRCKLIVMGHSAGAHIAAMLAFDRKWFASVGLDARLELSAMIGLAGPYDFLPLRSRKLKKIFGPKEGLAATQPINFVDALAPPAFLATGTRDLTVRPANTIRLAERIRKVGGEVEMKLYKSVTHRTLVGAMARPLRFLAPVLDDVTSFARKHSHPQASVDWLPAPGRFA